MTRRLELSTPVDAADHVLGPPRASATLVEYGDFECPNCKQAVSALKILLRRHEGRVRLVWRNFPLEAVHPHALGAALSAEAAGGQGKFWSMHDVLFANQQHLKGAQLRRYAEQVELDLTRYDADIADRLYLQRVREDIESGVASGVRATPTFFLNGAIVDVSFGLQHLFDRVDGELSAA
jgi:protein-disulfide isomerase